MVSRPLVSIASLAAIALVGGPVLAQRPGNGVPEAAIYAGRDYQGSSYFLPNAQGDLRLGYAVRSIRIISGAWELCEQPGFQGRCVTFNSSSRDIGSMQVRSARPTRGGGSGYPGGGGIPPGGARGPGYPGGGYYPGGGGGDYRYWPEIGRSSANRGDWAQIYIRNNGSFRELTVCAERNDLNIRWAEARYRNGDTQSISRGVRLRSGECASPINVTKPPRQISYVTVNYQNSNGRYRDATVVVRAR